MKSKRSLDRFQEEVAAWGEATFGEGTPDSLLAHLILEVRELWDSHEPEEAADVLLLLLHFAQKQGFSLFEQAERKLTVIRGRVWGTPNADGVVEHVRSS
jgi:NTP pyrophosphatase (non-canonical NTP hydrolase)